MSFFAAEFSRPVIFAMVMLYATLAVVSIGVTVGTRPSNKLRLQVNAWWSIFPIVSLSLALYPVGPLLLFFVIGILALRDLAATMTPQRKLFHLTCLGILGLTACSAMLKPQIAALSLPLAIAIQLAVFARRKEQRCLLLLLFCVLCYGMSFIIRFMQLPNAPSVNLAWLFLLFVLTALNDIGQFIFGTLFGKYKIVPYISPNKTWEGLAGGSVTSIIISVSLGSYLQLDTVGHLAVYAALLSISGFAGDVMFSAAKRYFGVKDFSNLIPGHGGILDRADSLVLTAPTLYFSLIYLS